MTDEDDLASPDDVAKYLSIPVRTLAIWRQQGKGPKFYKIGRHVRYSWTDIEAWITENTHVTRESP